MRDLQVTMAQFATMQALSIIMIWMTEILHQHDAVLLLLRYIIYFHFVKPGKSLRTTVDFQWFDEETEGRNI